MPEVDYLERLDRLFGKRAKELLSHATSGGSLSGPVEEVAAKVWRLSQLWLTFLDGDDAQFVMDRAIYDQVCELAASTPRCSIEEEAVHWMQLNALEMTDFEISLALLCSVDRFGSVLILNGNYDETRQDLIDHRNRWSGRS